MEKARLVDRFRVADVDQSELEQLFLEHFSRSTGVSPSEIHYLHANEDQPALVLTYDSDGELVAIESGPGLREPDVAGIEGKIGRLLLASTGTAIGQTVLFAHLPTTGYFRYGDVFQIVPVPPEAPRPGTFIGDHPLLLQFAFPSSVDFQINQLRRGRVGREIELLCIALTTSIWKSDGNLVRHHWVLRSDPDPTKWKSEFLQGMYTYQGAGGLAPGFADTTAIPALAVTPQATYYPRVGISPGQVLDLPEGFDGLLDRFFQCPREDRDRFLRSSFWFQHAQRCPSGKAA